jgi:hypothetical protein
MANKPQTLSQGQRTEVVKIIRNQVLAWTLVAFAILTGITGVGLWQIYSRVQTKMENLVVRQFEEPRIKQVVQEVAATQATNIMLLQIQPEVARFKGEIAERLLELQRLVAKSKSLEEQSQDHQKAIERVLTSLNQTLQESQITRDKIVGLQSDVIKMQKCVSRIQYFTLKGANQFPNPYNTNIVGSLNEMLSIAIPNPVERNKFIMELGGPNL